MDKSFDFASMLKNHQKKKHKSKPMQFESIAGGVHRRLENNLKHRKSTRLTSFDCIRNLSQSNIEPLPEVNQKNPERRRQQLEKWKEEKENKKKLMAAQKKKKPFIATAVQQYNPLKYVPPPPVKPTPSTSGCVTRSQSARHKKDETKQPQTQSFAPKNAGFRAPEIKTLTKLPKLSSANSKKNTASYTFNPVPPAPKPAAMQTRSRAYNRIVAESRQNRNMAKNTRATSQALKQPAKPGTKVQKSRIQSNSSSENEPSQMQATSSSSSENQTAKIISSSTEDYSDANYSSENDTSKSLKSLQSSSGDDISTDKTPNQKRLQFISSSESEKESPVNKSRKSFTKTSSISKKSSNTSENKMNTPKNPIPKSESSSEEKLRSPKSPHDVPMTPEQVSQEFRKISPCVTLSRGKDNARREMKKKLEEGLFEEDESDIDSVEHFQRQLTSEIKRMTEMCDVWDNVYEQVSLPESVQELVLGAVGQARLLMSQKMQQFSSLVQRCARPDPAAPLVTPADLRGFWDMIFMQVENVDMRFKKLEELRARNWVEEVVPAAAVRRPRAAPARSRAAPARSRAAPASKLRDMIAAARKAKSQTVQPPATPEEKAVQAPVTSEEKTFEAGFFSIRSPARSPAPRTPRTPVQRDRTNLLKAVLSSEAEKASASKKSASFAMLRASVLAKNVDCDGVEPLPQTPVPNLSATPGRSILKQPQESAKKTNKQIRIVLFDHIRNMDSDSSTEDLDTQENNTSDSKTNDLLSKEIGTREQLSKEITTKELSAEKIKQKELNNSKLLDSDGKFLEEKENAIPKLVRQNAVSIPDAEVEATPRMMTRRMRKSMASPQIDQNVSNLDTKTPRSEKNRRSTKKNVLAEVENTIEEEKTPRRSLRRRKTDLPKVG